MRGAMSKIARRLLVQPGKRGGNGERLRPANLGGTKDEGKNFPATILPGTRRNERPSDPRTTDETFNRASEHRPRL